MEDLVLRENKIRGGVFIMRTIIDIEGLDGSGKNTQFNLLIEKLKNDIVYKKKIKLQLSR